MKNILRTAFALLVAAMMCVAVVADTSVVVPSIEQKAAPSVEEDSVVATTADGEEVSIDAAEIVVTPYSEKDTLEEDTKTALEEAYEQILTVDSLAELESSIPEDHTAAYLFDISVTGDAADILAAGGSVTVTFEVNLGGASSVSVLHNYSGSHWREEPSEIVGTNKIQVTFSSTSPFVITVSNDSTIVIDEPVESGIIDSGVDSFAAVTTSSTMPYVIGGVACIVIAGVLLIVANKKKTN